MVPRKITLGALAATCFLFASAQLQAQTPPPNDRCEDVTPGLLAIGGTLIFEGNNENATTTGDNVPGGGLDAFNSAVVWEAFTISECANVRISFCGSVAAFLSTSYWNALATECPANNLVVTLDYNNLECSDGQPVLYFPELPAGTYYYPVYADQGGPHGDYVLEVSATACGTAPPVADAGPDQFLCSSSNTATMAANTPDAPATGTWSVVSGSFSIADPSDPHTELTGLAIGENVAAWTVDDGAGNTAADQVSIFVFDETNPEAYAGPDQEVCGTNAVLQASTVVFPATGVWSVAGGTGSFADSSDPNTTVSGLSIGENKFVWTVDNSPCANGTTSDMVTIVVIDTTGFVAHAGPGLSTCSSTDTILLQATAPQAPATGTWALVSGSATIVDPNDPQSPITDLSIGEAAFAWTVEYSGPCGTGISSDTVRVVVYDADHAVADAGTDQDLQEPVDHTTLAANAANAPATGSWTLVSGSATFTDPNDPNTAVTELAAGANVLRWTINNGACGTSSDDVTITVTAQPVIPALMPGDTLQIIGNNSTAVDSVGLGVPAAWAAFNLGECANVRVDYCAMATPFTMFSNGLYADMPGGAMVLPDSMALCANDSPELYYTALQPGIYWIAVLMDPDDASGDYELTITATACATVVVVPNDSCANAQAIVPQGSGPIYTAGVFGTLSGATLTPPIPVCADDFGVWQDLWYSIEVEDNDLVLLELDTTLSDVAGLEVFRSCTDTSIACSNDGEPLELGGLTAGTLIIRVFSQEPDTFLLLVTVDRSTGIRSADMNSFTLHPNPGNGNFTIDAPFTSATAHLTIRDMAGRMVAERQTAVSAGQPVQVSLQGQLNPGMYTVELSNGVVRSHARLVVQ